MTKTDKYKQLDNIFSKANKYIDEDTREEKILEVIDANKQKAYEEQKEMRDEISFYALNCPKFKLFKLYDEYKRIKKDNTE